MENIENQNAEPVPEKQRRKMKKGWKITLISLGSLIGVFVIAVVLTLYLVLTPARLTSIVNKLADKYITCESHFDKVDLTLLKTFPFVGLDVHGVSIVNPMPQAPSDTVAFIDRLVVGINAREYLKHGNIEVKKLHLENTNACLFTDKEGDSNFDIFPASEDTTASEPFEMPELVSLKSIRIKNLNAIYVDMQSDINVRADRLNLDVDGHYDNKDVNADMELAIDDIAFNMGGDNSVSAKLHDIELLIKGGNKADAFDGDIDCHVEGGTMTMNGQEFVNEVLRSGDDDLIRVSGHVTGDWGEKHLLLEKFEAKLREYVLSADGDVVLPVENKPMSVDLRFSTNTWNVDRLLDMMPQDFTSWRKGMQLNADAVLSGTAKGELGDSLLPQISAHLLLHNGSFSDRSIIPYDLLGIDADISADLDLNNNGISNVDVTRLVAHSGRNNLEVTGRVEDLLGAMHTDAAVKGNIYLADLRRVMPEDIVLDGRASLNLKAKTNLKQLQNSDFKHMKLAGTIGLNNVDVEYDSIFAQIPQAVLNVQLPATMKRGLFDELLSATITCSDICAELPSSSIEGTIGRTKLQAAISDIFDTTQPFKLVCDFDFASVEGNIDSILVNVTSPTGSFAMIPQSVNSDRVKYQINFTSSAMHCDLNDSTTIDLAGLSVKGGANYDPSKPNTLQQWSPNLDVDFKRGYIDLEQFDYMVQIPDIKFNYKPERCEIASANVVFGNSDFYLSGAVTGLEKWLSHEEMLRGDLYFTSNYTNVDDLMEAFSGLGTDADTIEAQRKEDNVDTAAHPFIVPKDVDFTLHTRIKEATAFENDLREVAGDVRIRDGVAVLNQVGFVCKAAKMQLTGMYRTPRVNHIFLGMDFHLLDINIQELIEMIPYVDTLVPILEDLEGNADFHLCAETYLNAFYKPKMSTLRAAAALTGHDLVVLDNKDIDKIAKLLKLKNWREEDSKIHVDSIDVAMTVFRKELEVYPFLLSLHKYQIVAEGRHNLNNNYDYHVELVESPLPVRLAVDVLGTLPQLKFELSPSLRYKNLYRPAHRSEVDNEVLRLKSLIRQSLEANVKEDTRNYEGFHDDEE